MSYNEPTSDSARYTMGDEDFSHKPVAQSTPVRKKAETMTNEGNQSQMEFSVDNEVTIASLQDDICKYKEELDDLKYHVNDLIEDNDKLSKELRDNVEARMRLVSGSLNNPEVELLRKQVETLTEAKESVLKMWNIALQEIERLENELEKSQMGTNIDILETKIKEIKRDYDKAVESLSSEMNITKENLSQSKETTLSLKKELDKYMELNTELNVKLNEKDKEIKDTKSKLQECQNQIFQSESNITDKQKEIQSWETRFQELQTKNGALQEQIKTLQLREIELESNAADAVQQAKDSMKLAENAVFEKDVAVFREHQAKKEIEGLQLAMNKIVDSASEKTKIVMENVKKKCDEKIANLEEEIKNLDTELGEKRAIIERITREKKQAETELSKFYNEKDGSTYQALIEELSQKLTTVQIERDQALSKIKNLETNLKHCKETSLEDLNFKDAEIEQLRGQLAAVQRSFKSSANERLELINKVALLQKRCMAQQEENEAFRSKLKKDINYFENTLREQQEEHKRHIEDRCQMHNDTIFELRSLVDAQQKMVYKWKDEAKRLTEKFEREVTKLSSEVHPLKEEKKRLKRDLEDAENRLAQCEEQLHNITMENMRLNNRVQLLDELSKVSNRTRLDLDTS